MAIGVDNFDGEESENELLQTSFNVYAGSEITSVTNFAQTIETIIQLPCNVMKFWDEGYAPEMFVTRNRNRWQHHFNDKIYRY
jgi:hypothetical protein